MTEAGRTTTYGYDLRGSIAKKQLPQDTGSEMSYDAMGRLESILARAGGNDLSQITNQYDLAGNVRFVEEEYFTVGLTGRTVTNTYDNADRLIQESIDLGSDNTADIITSYVYDGGNNRTQRTVVGGGNPGVTNYAVNNRNQLIAVSGPEGSATFSYDANGSRTTRAKDGEIDAYTYDGENRLVQLVKAAPDTGLTSGTFRYVYDYRTRRVERDESDASGNTTKLVFSGGTTVFEREDNATTVEYIRGSDYGGGVGGILYTLRAGAPSYTHYNNRGDVVAKTDASGTASYLAAYEAFGKRTQQYGSTADRQKANTKEEDPTGLLNEGFRYRDLETGAFITADPLGFVDGPNMYAYVRQNPWTKFDPEGLWETDSYLGDVAQVWKGYGQAVGDVVGGIAHTVTHPIQTAQGIGSAIAHPVATAKAAGNAIVETWDSGLEGQGRVVGNALIAVGTSAASFAKGGQVANAASKAEQLSQIASAESKAATAGEIGTSAARTVAKTEQAVTAASEGTTATGRTVGELRQAGLKDAHHSIQDAAVRDIPGYNTNLAPGEQLAGPSTRVGSPHYKATQVQRQAGGGTYGAERRIGYKALRQGGLDKSAARSAIERADKYFESIGVTRETPTRIPGNRR